MFLFFLNAKIAKIPLFFFQKAAKVAESLAHPRMVEVEIPQRIMEGQGVPHQSAGGVMAAIMFRGRSDSSTRRTSKKTNQNT